MHIINHTNQFTCTAYEKAFILVAKAGKIHKDNLVEFFNRCDLWPTQGDISRAFETIFRGTCLYDR